MNVLTQDKQIVVVSALAEGNSIQVVDRMTGVHMQIIQTLSFLAVHLLANWIILCIIY